MASSLVYLKKKEMIKYKGCYGAEGSGTKGCIRLFIPVYGMAGLPEVGTFNKGGVSTQSINSWNLENMTFCSVMRVTCPW